MNRYEALELRRRLVIPESEYDYIEKKPKVYVPVPAHETFDKHNVSLDNIYLEKDIVDETDSVIEKINYYIERVIAKEYICGEINDEVFISISPLLFYRADTIISDDESLIADSPELDYFPDYIKVFIEIISIKDNKEKLELRDNSIFATVNFYEFTKRMAECQYGIGCDNFYALARSIISAGKEERMIELRADVIAEHNKKSYFEEIDRRKSL